MKHKQNNIKKFLYNTYHLYYDGFTSMKLGKTLWTIILIKLFIMFGILKFFFFPDFLHSKAEKGGEAEFVSEQLMNHTK